MEVKLAGFGDERSNGNIEAAFAIESETPDRARVETARTWLKLSNNLTSPLFRCSRDTASRKAGAEGVKVTNFFAQSSLDCRDEVKDLSVAFQF